MSRRESACKNVEKCVRDGKACEGEQSTRELESESDEKEVQKKIKARKRATKDMKL